MSRYGDVGWKPITATARNGDIGDLASARNPMIAVELMIISQATVTVSRGIVDPKLEASSVRMLVDQHFGLDPEPSEQRQYEDGATDLPPACAEGAAHENHRRYPRPHPPNAG